MGSGDDAVSGWTLNHRWSVEMVVKVTENSWVQLGSNNSNGSTWKWEVVNLASFFQCCGKGWKDFPNWIHFFHRLIFFPSSESTICLSVQLGSIFSMDEESVSAKARAATFADKIFSSENVSRRGEVNSAVTKYRKWKLILSSNQFCKRSMWSMIVFASDMVIGGTWGRSVVVKKSEGCCGALNLDRKSMVQLVGVNPNFSCPSLAVFNVFSKKSSWVCTRNVRKGSMAGTLIK